DNVDLSRNVSRGQITAAKENGSWTGLFPCGYELVGPPKKRRLIPNDQQRVVKRIFREFVDQQRSLNEIAKRLTADDVPTRKGGPWRYDAVKTILQNPAYIGTFRTNRSTRCKYGSYRNGSYVAGASHGMKDEKDWIVKEDAHEPIIDRETFERAQVILNST